jgi:hypothetical protein
MANFDNEPDDSLLEQDEKQPSGGDWNRPMLLAGIGLALMLGGYAAMSYVPPMLEKPQQERQLQQLRNQAAQRQAEGTDDGLSERLERFQPPARHPPYQLLGRLAIYGGLFLFVMAGVLMYRSSPSPPHDSERPT